MTPDLRLYLVTDPAYDGLDGIVSAAVAGGVTCVQVRDKQASSGELAALAGRLRAVLPVEVAVIVNDDAEAARVCDGLHVGVDDLPPTKARELLGPDAVIGWSINDLVQLGDEVQLAACDYVAASPVWTTATKADADRPWGLSGVRALADALGDRVPLVAIGGIEALNAGEVIEAGADGVAVVSAICAADDPEAAAHGLRAAVDQILTRRTSR